MRNLPLFHQISGQPVLVLGEGDAAEAKARLVERAGGIVLDDLQEAIDQGVRLAFVAHEDDTIAEADTLRLRTSGLLVNVVDKPDLCDFTTPSLLDRDPVLIAIGTGGASAGLAKHVRLRLEAILPQSLGKLAKTLFEVRSQLKARWPGGAERRRALDAALSEGGSLDPLNENAHLMVTDWVSDGVQPEGPSEATIQLRSDDPDDLTLREARLLGQAELVLFEEGIPEAILNRARADAERLALPHEPMILPASTVILKR